VVDGVSWRFLLEDLRSAYRQSWAGEAIRLPLKTDSLQTWARRIQEYAQREVLAEAPYWQRLTMTDWSRLPVERQGEPACYGNRPQQSFQLTTEETLELLGEANRAYQTEPNDLLLTALANALARWHGRQTSVVLLEGHGREALFDEIDISRTVGWFTSYYPVVLPLSAEDDLGKQIKQIKEMLRDIPYKGIGYGILEQLTPSALVELDFPPLPEVSFNYLGRFDDEFGDDIFHIASETVGQGIDPAARPIHDLEITGVTLNGRLRLAIAYNSGRFYAETIARFAREFEASLRSIIAHTRARDSELTPSDIDYDGFDIEQLDQFLDRLQ
jgi:non-ribosomal peptide synthase protein (TIGR01720 family)